MLAAANVKSLADIPNTSALLDLQRAIEVGQYGVQNIRSDYFISPFGPAQIKLPQSFTVFGQKFVLDSWALSKVVFDDILWEQGGLTNKVCRRVPSCLDVAFGVLGNNNIVPDLIARITDQSAAAHPSRDGKYYQHNLAAVRTVLDKQTPESWTSSVYADWLGTLRELSQPIMAPNYPQVLRTRAWAMKSLNTQMASWSQLRHDTILYAKQSYIRSFSTEVCSTTPSRFTRISARTSGTPSWLTSTPIRPVMGRAEVPEASCTMGLATSIC
jgi:hypothetical protein